MIEDLDIFITSGRGQFDALQSLLPRLTPHGRVHLFSSYLTPEQIHSIEKSVHAVHRPTYHERGYKNFRMACNRDINRLARGPYFVKLDTDVTLASTWTSYISQVIRDSPELVLFGPRGGKNMLNVELNGPVIRSLFGKDVSLKNAQKVAGGFYVGKTSFWKEHDEVIQKFVAMNADENRPPPEQLANSAHQEYVPWEKESDDKMRSTLAHLLGPDHGVAVIPSKGLILVPPTRGQLAREKTIPRLIRAIQRAWTRRR